MAQTHVPSQAVSDTVQHGSDTVQHRSDTVPEYTQIQRSMITFDVDDRGKKVKLGDGGFGVVYQGRYSALGDIRVAIKRIKNSNYGITAREQVLLEREACEMYRARHSAVLTVYGLVCDTATDDDQMYCLVTEHMEMGSLHDLIDKHPIPWEVKVKMLMAVANGMNYLSSLMTGKNRQLVHGDIKSNNILIDGHFNAKIGDFGIAVLQTITSRSTGVYFKGTITHVAPELLDIPEDKHGNYDPKPTQKSDVWSFGVTMFEVAADVKTDESDHPAYRTPFPVGMNHDQIRAKITRRMGTLFTPDQRRKIPAECPGFYLEVMERSCIVDREERPEFREVFSSLQEKLYSECEPSFYGAMSKLYDQFQKQRPSRDEMARTITYTKTPIQIQKQRPSTDEMDRINTEAPVNIQKVAEMEKEIERRKQITEETILIDQNKTPDLFVLFLNDISSELENQFRDMLVKIDIDARKITITGVADDVKEAKFQVHAKINEIKEEEKQIAEEIMKILKRPSIKSYVSERFSEQNIKASYEVKFGNLTVYSLSDSECNRAMSVIEKSIKKQQVKFDDSQLLKSSKWFQKKADLIEEYGQFISVTESESSLVIVATENIMDDIYIHILEFVEQNTIKEEVVSAKLGVVRAFSNNDKIIQTLQEVFKDISLKIICEENKAKPGLKLKGSITGLTKAVEEVKAMINRIKHKKHVLDKPGMATYFEEDSGRQMLRTIENSTKVAIELSQEKDKNTYSSTFDEDTRATLAYEIDLVIYGFDSHDIQCAIGSIEKTCSEQSGERIIDGPENSDIINKLTDEQISKIKMLQSTYEVCIIVQKGSTTNKIVIQGRKKDIAEVYVNIKEFFFEAEKKEIQQKLEDDLYAKIQWQYEQTPGKYKDYDRNINYLIESSYKTHQSDAHWEESDGSYVITFANLQEHTTGDNVSATVYGNGVYFSGNANYSHPFARPDENGTRIMYLCKVITGEYTQGNAGLLCPPPKDPKHPNIQYDSVVDNVKQPNMYVVYYDDQAYPEYAITYTAT